MSGLGTTTTHNERRRRGNDYIVSRRSAAHCLSISTFARLPATSIFTIRLSWSLDKDSTQMTTNPLQERDPAQATGRRTESYRIMHKKACVLFLPLYPATLISFFTPYDLPCISHGNSSAVCFAKSRLLRFHWGPFSLGASDITTRVIQLGC